MNQSANATIYETTYDRADCAVGVVHLGFGAFHRAHQAQYIDDYMQKSGDLAWGIAAVNLRAPEADVFAQCTDWENGYLLKSTTPDGEVSLRRVRSHVAFSDWSKDVDAAEDLLAQASVHMVTITVTESGYYTDPKGALDANDPTIAAEVAGGAPTTVYAYLQNALKRRMDAGGAPITVCCCDNIRQNGKMLKANFAAYLTLTRQDALAQWVAENVTFPCSMVDRITPRSTAALSAELSEQTGETVNQPIAAEAFVQWVLQNNFAGPMPALDQVDVTVTDNVDPYEETKIRVLNGGHTCLTYLGALHGIETFDAAMRVPELFDHFWNYETQEVLPALTIELPFSKEAYLDDIAARFKNEAIADTVARICADGVAKFPIFIRPTLEGCLKQGVMPHHGIRSIASWYVFAQHVAAGRIPFDYLEPSWEGLKAMLGTDEFVTSQQLWGDLPTAYPAFADTLRAAIKDMEQSWPV
ncbi:mannitol dehydrogenase family protein [Loktanella sp. S4079]|uniref:mannitol dehydrogenase family protein n=1 Tax=Loktanella sp. S4079 TaxID=579483 RepID=UPI0005FA5565|nr:mannitol dehydrogenase family protein [Loktanella sp. S4079]KJZ20529.1 mannitol-1-phosphate 5-dehydrogenase [Loktanella sp. S4079]